MRRSDLTDDGGQVLAIVALTMVILIGMSGLAIDIGWHQLNVLRVQRAADAAALAGAVYLPGNPTGAFSAARDEATKNGYTDGLNGVTVTPGQDPINKNLLAVTIGAPVRSFFARFFGITSFGAQRRARAEFILPIPMGSPQDYYGIHELCDSGGSCTPVGRAPNASSAPWLASQGFWGAMQAQSGQREYGDAYSPLYNGGTSPNPNFDPNGYSYVVELPTGTTNGEVWLFDATFCSVGSNIGTGDRWQSGSGPITTEYRLWDTLGTPYATTDDVLLAESGLLFANEAYSSPNCQNAYHNKWYRLGSGLGAGTYRLQVTTTAPTGSTTSGANEFGIQVLSNGPAGARVYGLTRIAMYSNVNSGTSLFYCCQIEAAHAGKTLEIKLFDPGDVGGNATLRIKKPTASGYVNATFSYTSTSSGSGSSGNNVTSLTTATGGSSPFNNHWVTITIVLPTNYGVGGITPPGETEPGWWKIEYTITAEGYDTTTWEASIRGTPVHLVIP